MDLVNQLSEETIFYMGQNNNINERSMDNTNTYFCAKCLRELDSEDRDVVKDIDENCFCDRECRKDFYLECRQDMDDIMSDLR